MNLKETSYQLLEDSKRTPIRGLTTIAEAEKYLQQAYEGRYIFELIQNVRDANKEVDEEGDIFIELRDSHLSISNTGAEFSPKGIESITTIGKSTKRSQDYIGFKGIGFKSIQEITDTPSIITRYGTVNFDRKKTLQEYRYGMTDKKELKEEDIPLFYFPHYNDQKLSQDEMGKGITTRINLPLKAGVSTDTIIAKYSEIQAKQLILLGNIKELKFESRQKSSQILIKKKPQNHLIEVTENGSISKFKYFTPSSKVKIPDELIQKLEGREKEIFSDSAFVDINIVLELSEKGVVLPVENSKLYLFYPLQISSGFRFIIHSYFIVNPERTALRTSALNDFLLRSIGEFISGEMLTQLKSTKINTNKILCFERNNDAKIAVLYDSLVEGLKNRKFIYDNKTKKYFLPSEVIIADHFDKGLFPNGKLGDKTLIYADGKDIVDWLVDEFNVKYLHYQDIANEIENECKAQLKKKNVRFFQNLYNYTSKHNDLNLIGKKVLLTDHWRLVSSEEDVFYGGSGKDKQKPVKLIKSIQKQIYFIHKDIIIKDFREGKSRTGITEYSGYELVRRLMKLFNKSSVPKGDLLNTLFNLPEFDAKSVLEIREKILLPIKGKSRWLSPITHPVYFENDHLKQLYPNGNFVDEEELIVENNIRSKESFLKQFGVWDIPAVFISAGRNQIGRQEKRDYKINRISEVYSRPFYIINDRVLDIPEHYNSWFTTIIIENWAIYQSFIQNEVLPRLSYASSSSSSKYVNKENWINISHFIEILSTEKWISLKGENQNFAANEVVAINSYDFAQNQNRVIARYLNLLPMDIILHRDLIKAVDLVHLDGYSIDNFKRMFELTFKKYENEVLEGKEFIDFYNRLLAKLVAFYEERMSSDTELQKLKTTNFLCIDDITRKIYWRPANEIFYIDDKPAYDILPEEIKKQIQPHFTNRDKNTFGKIAGKIGLRFSKSIEKELIETTIINTETLLSYFKYLPESIALLESHVGDAVTKHLDTIRLIRVFEKEILKVKISVGNSAESDISVSHFIDVDSNFDMHLQRLSNSFKENKQIADAMNELFISLLDRDLRSFNANLLNFLDSLNKVDYLNNYGVTTERIAEIRDKLNDFTMSPIQKFWEAVLIAKNIVNHEDVYKDSLDFANLANLLEVDLVILQHFDAAFDYEKTSSGQNISILNNFLAILDLTLEKINKTIFPKIDFRDYYQTQMIRLKNNYRHSFNAVLHSCLDGKDTDEKSTYQSYLDRYDAITDFQIPINSISLEIKDFFIKHVTNIFSFLNIQVSDLENNYEAFKPIEIYTHNYDLLEKNSASVYSGRRDLDHFLNNNKLRSLLYFNETEFLVKEFTDWYTQTKNDSDITAETELKTFLQEFSDQAHTIVNVSTQRIDITSKNGNTSGGNGKRYDGGANDEFKKKLGMAAEMIVFETLCLSFQNVTWVSKYAGKIYSSHKGYNPEGRDGLGYDIEYFDADGNKYFVEVKGKASDENSFEISKKELEKAGAEGSNYMIILVTQTLSNEERRIRNLGNLFMFEEGETFFLNSRFSAVYKDFEIRFNENE